MNLFWENVWQYTKPNILLFDMDRTTMYHVTIEAQQIRYDCIHQKIPWEKYGKKIDNGEVRLYDGMKKHLLRFKEKGYYLVFISKMPDIYIRKILDKYGIPYDAVYGHHQLIEHKSDKEIIHTLPDPYLFKNKILPKFGGDELNYMVIGNSKKDIDFANNCGIRSGLAGWDSRPKEDELSLLDYPPTQVWLKIEEMGAYFRDTDYLLQKCSA